MNRKEFAKLIPFSIMGLLIPSLLKSSEEKPTKTVEHIHINGDNITVKECTVHGSIEQPAILCTKPIKLFNASGNVVYRSKPIEVSK